jgi:hypothetical protein
MPPHVVNKLQNRLGLVNGRAISIHHAGDRTRIWPPAFIFDERRWALVNRWFADAGETHRKCYPA